MTVELNHTIVAARDSEESARFYERFFGFSHEGSMGPFVVVRIPGQALTLDFMQQESFDSQHYAFKVSEAEFDEIFGRIEQEGLVYGSGPTSSENGEINHWGGGRGVYFRDPSGHMLELLTRDYTPELFGA